jgi:hypothetical protein
VIAGQGLAAARGAILALYVLGWLRTVRDGKLGVVDGRPYAIHDLWRYRRPDGDTILAGRVVVTDLPIEPSEKRHTLLERLTHAQFVR